MDVLFEDDYLLVVNKPAGVATQSQGVGTNDLESECKKYRKRKGEPAQIFVVHRLDQPVAGILVFAKTKQAAAILTQDLQKDSFSKIYKARVYASKVLPEAELRDYLVKDAKSNTSKVCAKTTAGAKEAVLIYKLLDKQKDTALLLVNLQTGRHHQIRVQLSNAGMPILGDIKYGSKESIEASKKMGLRFIELCACHLEFTHPITKQHMEYSI